MADMKTDGKMDQLKGKARETWGDVTGDEADKAQGKTEQAIGKAKERTGETTEAVREKLGKDKND